MVSRECRAPGWTGADEHGTAEAAGTGSVRRTVWVVEFLDNCECWQAAACRHGWEWDCDGKHVLSFEAAYLSLDDAVRESRDMLNDKGSFLLHDPNGFEVYDMVAEVSEDDGPVGDDHGYGLEGEAVLRYTRLDLR